MLIIPGAGKRGETFEYDLAIIGSGPAGLTAGIYSSRAGLQAVIVEKNAAGGLAAEAPYIENYPGFIGIKGQELASRMKEHAKNYLPIFEMSPISKIEKQDTGKFFIESHQGNFSVSSIIFATGTTHKHLNIKGEKEFSGKGISYCVTCDGPFFKDHDVIIIGGGNSGAAAAIYMSGLAKKVTILECMPRTMCENAYTKKIEELGIEYIKNAKVTEIFGDDVVRGLRYVDKSIGKEYELKADGVFIYIGLSPQSELAKSIGCQLNNGGYIKVDDKMRTSVPFVYAAGDVTGGVAQIIVAAAQGAIAALSCFEDLSLK
ncbi:MAG TPA: FAD-dependent oxidoreductase [Candidatus Hydrothermia bacterium]|nr:FAD-dependent oxidoreductase [Candidatus Hydrothermia bacterium]